MEAENEVSSRIGDSDSGQSTASPPSNAEPEVNVGTVEREVSIIGGAALSLMGLKRGGLSGTGLVALGGMLVHREITGYCPLYAKFNLTQERHDPDSPQDYFARAVHVENSVTVNRPNKELYAIWRDFSNLPRFMQHLKSVKVIDEKRSLWVAEGPLGSAIQWEAEMIDDEPPRLIAWRSTKGGDIATAGSVQFISSSQDGATEIRVVLDYIPPVGTLGDAIARMFSTDPHTQIADDLRRFKQQAESGTVSLDQRQTVETGRAQ